jgi:hypothetical protein
MGQWDFSDGPFCEDFDDAKDAKELSSTLMLWRERAAQKDAKPAPGGPEMRPGAG